jgi:hypothetical protein
VNRLEATRLAMNRPSATGTMSSVRCTTRVGTLILGSRGSTPVSLSDSTRARAMAGLAAARSKRAWAVRAAGSSAWLRANSPIDAPVPQAAAATRSCCMAHGGGRCAAVP